MQAVGNVSLRAFCLKKFKITTENTKFLDMNDTAPSILKNPPTTAYGLRPFSY